MPQSNMCAKPARAFQMQLICSQPVLRVLVVNPNSQAKAATPLWHHKMSALTSKTIMLIGQSTNNHLIIYSSPMLTAIGVPHAFSTRLGGISPAPFDTIEHVEENYRRLKLAIGCESRDRCWVTQVHGNTVCDVQRGIGFENGPHADALVSDDPGRLLSVKYADCVPILLATGDGRAVAAVHAGWRGVVAGVLNVTVERLAQVSPASNLVAAIGPCIGEPYFEVGPEVLTAFEQLLGTDAPIRRTTGDKGHVDLTLAVRLQLLGAGLKDERIDTTDRCTFRDETEFFSHRRDKGVTGRMAAMIGAIRT